MASDLEAYFDSDAERIAYEEFCASQERGLAGFDLDAPALVCRWRMANKHVPLLNRHIRALSQRTVNGASLSHNMLSWAKQHVEWSLAEGDYRERDGVLMLVIDVNGNAAMTVGAYEPLADTSRPALVERAAQARIEALETGVAPELLGAMASDGRLLIAAAPDEHVCGAATLVEQLASTRGRAVEQICPCVADIPATPSLEEMRTVLDAFCAEAGSDAAFFLVSDEHGIAPADQNASADSGAAAFVAFLADGYQKLFSQRR